MKTYEVDVKMVFKAKVTVRANTWIEDVESVRNNWGCTLNNASCSNVSESETEPGIIDWDINPHPEQKNIS